MSLKKLLAITLLAMSTSLSALASDRSEEHTSELQSLYS